MRVFLFAIVLMTSLASNKSYSQVSNTSYKEPFIGCLAMGTLAYALGQSGQMIALSCTAGGVAGYTLERHYTNAISDRYEREILQLQHQLDEFVIKRALDAKRGDVDESDFILKKTIIPSRKLDDGSFMYETIKITPTLPGLGHRIGE